jgi:hypothetical protein
MTWSKSITTLLVAMFLMACSDKAPETVGKTEKPSTDSTSVIQKVHVIKVKDPKASMVGYKKPGEDYFEISLDDVGKYTGHVCGGVASGYILTQKALELLYPENEIPVRGQISIAASDRIDPLEVATYIVRAREGEGEEKETNICVIDTTLRGQPGSHTVIVKRADTGISFSG